MDIPLLARSFLQHFNRKLGKADQTISSAAIAKLYNSSWPGNVRELKNVIERASVLSDSDEIGADAILLSHETTSHGNRINSGLAKGSTNSLKDIVGFYEREILLDTLNSSPSIRKAAQRLSISHTALLKKIEKYKLQCGNKTNRWIKNEPQN
ncbi:AAA-type ATPase lid domain-containing protein [Desulfopila aestuarii]|uniref:TyrR family helix-turn-helix domain-containing protein n=1 Tax=Desulfopila aestuarii DSM 18488 TaxID=1121416 RepID=A0A1M7YBH2_9BACT|nr:TyrR/PhhR family helix-turn-helix DNA-binding protein [Desulfopila aestuarii]SHO49994.1 TyrR family helix-turn-helix domain-containing protein [Desulfopila aestuarii DSM 18488]